MKVLSLVSEIRRPSDGWGWTRAPRPAPAGCPAGWRWRSRNDCGAILAESARADARA